MEKAAHLHRGGHSFLTEDILAIIAAGTTFEAGNFAVAEVGDSLPIEAISKAPD
jgi:hypothetical protein